MNWNLIKLAGIAALAIAMTACEPAATPQDDSTGPTSHGKFYKGNPKWITWQVTKEDTVAHPSGDNLKVGDAFRLRLIGNGPNAKIKMVPIGPFRSRRFQYHGGNENFDPYPGKKLSPGGIELLCIESIVFDEDASGNPHDHYLVMKIDDSDPTGTTMLAHIDDVTGQPTDCLYPADGTMPQRPRHPGAYHLKY
jgi:hypothetical protein